MRISPQCQYPPAGGCPAPTLLKAQGELVSATDDADTRQEQLCKILRIWDQSYSPNNRVFQGSACGSNAVTRNLKVLALKGSKARVEWGRSYFPS